MGQISSAKIVMQSVSLNAAAPTKNPGQWQNVQQMVGTADPLACIRSRRWYKELTVTRGQRRGRHVLWVSYAHPSKQTATGHDRVRNKRERPKPVVTQESNCVYKQLKDKAYMPLYCNISTSLSPCKTCSQFRAFVQWTRDTQDLKLQCLLIMAFTSKAQVCGGRLIALITLIDAS
jgi:hypothetical protein